MATGVINHASAMKRLEALFGDVKLDNNSKPQPEVVEIETSYDAKCDVHGKNAPRRGSLTNVTIIPKYELPIFQHNFGSSQRRGSMPALNNNYRYIRFQEVYFEGKNMGFFIFNGNTLFWKSFYFFLKYRVKKVASDCCLRRFK